MITSQDVQQRIAAEIAAAPQLAARHAVLLERGLVQPHPIYAYSAADPQQQLIEVWLVFTEIPGQAAGYAVVYDAAENDFGLATYTMPDCVCLLTSYEEFLAAIDGM
jgi:hypothetical protein